jgi:hypothetical protein
MSKEERPKQTRRGLLLGGLAKIGKPPFTTPQWKDAVREQEQRGAKKDPKGRD